MSTTQPQRLVLDWTKVHDVIPIEKDLVERSSALVGAKQALVEGRCKGADFTGWVHFIRENAAPLVSKIKDISDKISQHSDAVVVIGIGGSLLGTRAVYEALTHSFASIINSESRHPQLFWAGHHLATDELVELLDALEHYSPTLIVVSKSGGTTEPAMAFRILKSYLEDRFGVAEARARIVAITDPSSGALLKVAQENGYPILPIPRNIGGRYSVFTAVGLLPLAIAGVPIDSLLEGAQHAAEDATSSKNDNLETNLALCYAGLRNILYQKGFKAEALCHWTPKLRSIAEWWKQLFGESDGKGQTGLLPTSASFTTDLHSLGQYFQEGERHLFATHIKVNEECSFTKLPVKRRLSIPDAHIKEGFEFLVQSDFALLQHEAQQGTFLAHADGGVPTLVWEWPELSPYWMGYWLYTNLFACAVGGIERGINPFDQPGVEAYKNNMFALIGKPGFEDKRAEIRARLERSKRLRSLGLSVR